MRVLLLAIPGSSHTLKWARALSKKGVKIAVFGLHDYNRDAYKNYPAIDLLSDEIAGADTTFIRKIYRPHYTTLLPRLRRTIREWKPDILHAHYATSYGLLGALAGAHPFIISLWGTDVFTFPNKSYFHKKLIEFNLSRADKILSTSHVMAAEAQKYTTKNIEITPFGIDMERFKPLPVESLFSPGDIVIGTIKTLESTYGIEYLIGAFKIVADKYPRLPLKLLIVGGGSQEKYLKRLTREYDIDKQTLFTGHIAFDDVPRYHNMLSVFVALSNSESFGVAVLEASACEKPVIVSNVGGLPEVVEDGTTGIIVPPRDSESAASALERLLFDEDLRRKMGKAGRDRVRRLYNWENNVQQMLSIYQLVLQEERHQSTGVTMSI